MSRTWRLGMIAAAVLLCRSGLAQTGRPYDGIDAGIDAYNRAEEQRQFKMSQQRALNEDLRARSYLPPGPVMFYGPGASYGVSGYSYPYSSYSSYSYASRLPFRSGRYVEQVVARPVAPAVIWPNRYYGINNYTYPFKLPVRQPVGQQQVQTGPNRWESHPVYDEPLPRFPVTPPVADDPLELRGPPGAVPASRESPPARTEPTPAAPSPSPIAPAPRRLREF